MKYRIISTGSKGNALHIEEGDLSILIDCGVPFLSICDLKLDLILLTHEHSDHMNISTIKRVLFNSPLTKVVAPPHLMKKLFNAKIPSGQIIMCTGIGIAKVYKKGVNAELSTFRLLHDVENIGWKINIQTNTQKTSLMYATDTASIDHIELPGLDYYFVEANYEDEEIEKRIAEKVAAGEFAYEFRARENHLSKAQADAWLIENAGEHSKFIYLHQHGGCCDE